MLRPEELDATASSNGMRKIGVFNTHRRANQVSQVPVTLIAAIAKFFNAKVCPRDIGALEIAHHGQPSDTESDLRFILFYLTR